MRTNFTSPFASAQTRKFSGLVSGNQSLSVACAGDLLGRLVDIQYNRNDFEFGRGTFQVRGNVIEVHPAYDDYGLKVELDFDKIVRLTRFDLVTGERTLAGFGAQYFCTTFLTAISFT